MINQLLKRNAFIIGIAALVVLAVLYIFDALFLLGSAWYVFLGIFLILLYPLVEDLWHIYKGRE